jgi:hypothetical protein
MSSLESLWGPFSTNNGCQNCHTRVLVKHTGLFFKTFPTPDVMYPQRRFRKSTAENPSTGLLECPNSSINSSGNRTGMEHVMTSFNVLIKHSLERERERNNNNNNQNSVSWPESELRPLNIPHEGYQLGFSIRYISTDKMQCSQGQHKIQI